VKVEFSVPEKYATIITPPAARSSLPLPPALNNTTARVVARESRLESKHPHADRARCEPEPGRVLLPGQSARLNLSLHESDNA